MRWNVFWVSKNKISMKTRPNGLDRSARLNLGPDRGNKVTWWQGWRRWRGWLGEGGDGGVFVNTTNITTNIACLHWRAFTVMTWVFSYFCYNFGRVLARAAVPGNYFHIVTFHVTFESLINVKGYTLACTFELLIRINGIPLQPQHNPSVRSIFLRKDSP